MVRASKVRVASEPRYTLPAGTPITMSPAGTPAVACLAEVVAWSVSPSGLVVTARVLTDRASAGQMDNRNVFVSGRTPDDALVVLEAVARRSADGDGMLELVSVAALAREHRRAAVRATVALPVLLTEPTASDEPGGAGKASAAAVSGTTIDLSGDGCRLRLDGGAPPLIGTDVVTLLDLGWDDPVRVTGVVVRSADSECEIMVSFDPMRVEDAAAIDARVYAALRR